jgi:hypothetical protein
VEWIPSSTSSKSSCSELMEGTVCTMDHQQVREAEVGRTNELSLMTIFPLMIST